MLCLSQSVKQVALSVEIARKQDKNLPTASLVVSFWCDDCLPLHNRIKAYKEHHALALKDFRDEDFESILKQPTFCAKHEKKELELFCQVCKITICNSCAFIDHEGHAKVALEDAAKETKVENK